MSQTRQPPKVPMYPVVGVLAPKPDEAVCTGDPVKGEHSWSYGLAERRCRRCKRVER